MFFPQLIGQRVLFNSFNSRNHRIIRKIGSRCTFHLLFITLCCESADLPW